MYVALKLNEMAASKGLSREAFLRNYFLTLTTKKEVQFAEDKLEIW